MADGTGVRGQQREPHYHHQHQLHHQQQQLQQQIDDSASSVGNISSNRTNQNDELEENSPTLNMSDDSGLMEESLPSIDQYHNHPLILDRFHSLRIYMTSVKSLPYNLRIHG